VTPQPCDRNFERAEATFRRAAENLQGAATTCVRQAGSDLARACRVVQDQDASQLGAVVSENLRSGNFENVMDACSRFTSGRRWNLIHLDPSPVELIVMAAISLEEACMGIVSDNLVDIISVGPNTVRSRVASGKVLQALHAR
jgi:hypothetical protein